MYVSNKTSCTDTELSCIFDCVGVALISLLLVTRRISMLLQTHIEAAIAIRRSLVSLNTSREREVSVMLL